LWRVDYPKARQQSIPIGVKTLYTGKVSKTRPLAAAQKDHLEPVSKELETVKWFLSGDFGARTMRVGSAAADES
jgi:hypothetical protein